MSKLIRGSGGGGKGGGGKARTPVEAPDSLRSIQYANVVDLISEGEIEGLEDGLKSVFFDDVPLQNPDGTFNFKNVVVSFREGTQSQEPIAGFSNSESEVPVGVEIKFGTPVVRTITESNVDAARITVSVPRLSSQNLTNGDLNGTSVSLKIEVQDNGGGYVEQALRKIFSNVFSSASGVFTNTVDSDAFQFTVRWTPETAQAPQTCTYKLQYRAVGDTDWIDKEEHTFSGGNFPQTGIAGISNIAFSSQQQPQTKTFSFPLAFGDYQFRLLKTNGSRSQAPSSNGFLALTPRTPLTGITYGGTVSIVSALAYTPSYFDVISGKTSSKYQRSYNIPLDGTGPWDIRVTRLTADSTNSALQNQTFWDSYTRVIEANLSYPNCALVATQIDAEQFSRIPVRRFNIKGMRVNIPNNYDPLQRSYDGAWDGGFVTAWTNNPAWIYYDLCTNTRYGLGDLITENEIDKWTLYNIAQYCDVMVSDGYGGIEPRFTCSLFLQTREEAYTVLSNLASSFRAMNYWSAGAVFVSQDSPKDVTQIFSEANVVNGEFNYSSSGSKVRHNVVLVTWNDPQDGFRTKVEYVSDDESIAINGVVQTELTAFGCTSRGQANRVGRWLIYSEQYETEVVTFRAGIADTYVQAGNIIQISDPNRSGVRHGGRVVSATTTQVVIDKAINIEVATDYMASFVLPDGTIETRSVTSPVGLRNTLILSSALTEAPQAFSMWLVSSTSVETESWRVITIAEVNKTELDITALSYRQDKFQYIEEGFALQPLNTSLINASRPNKPQGFSIQESLYLSGLGVVAVGATVSWQNSFDSKSYELIYYKDDDNRTVITTENNTIDIRPIEEGEYTFELVATNILGKKSEELISNVTIFGKTAPPNDLQGLSLSPLGSFGIFSWNLSTDLDVLVGGKVIFRFSPDLVSTWETAGAIAANAAGGSNTITLPLQEGRYFAKFEDSSGNVSINATSVTTNIISVLQLNLAETLDEGDWSGDKDGTEFDVTLNGLILSSDSDGVLSEGEYDLGQIDLGSVLVSRLIIKIEAYGIDSSDLWDSEELMDSPELMDGSEVTGVIARVFYRTTNDDPSGSPEWSEFSSSVVSDISARAIEFKLVLQSDSPDKNVLVKSVYIEVDMPERIQSGRDITSGTSTYSVVYSDNFYVAPAVGLIIHNMATGDYYTITNKTITGFDIDFYNASATQVSRNFDYIAKGY